MGDETQASEQQDLAPVPSGGTGRGAELRRPVGRPYRQIGDFAKAMLGIACSTKLRYNMIASPAADRSMLLSLLNRTVKAPAVSWYGQEGVGLPRSSGTTHERS